LLSAWSVAEGKILDVDLIQVIESGRQIRAPLSDASLLV